MSWRPSFPTKRYASTRRFFTRLQTKDEPQKGPDVGHKDVEAREAPSSPAPPTPPVADAFTMLAQRNLNRLRDLNQDTLAMERMARVRDLICVTEKLERYDELVARLEKDVTGALRVREERPTAKSQTRQRESDTLHEDLDSVLNAFRALDCEIPTSEQHPIDRFSYSEPAPGLRTSPLGRLASQYYQRKARSSPSNFSRACSSAHRPLKHQRFASSSVSLNPFRSFLRSSYKQSATEIKQDAVPAFLRGNGGIEHGIGGNNIRHHLDIWQSAKTLEAGSSSTGYLPDPANNVQNSRTQTGEDDSFNVIYREEDAEDDTLQHDIDEEGTWSVLNARRFFKRGDLVEFWSLNEPILSIFVKNLEDKSVFYTERGSWLVRRSGFAHFSFPNFVDPELLQDIVLYTPNANADHDDKLQPMSTNAPRGVGSRVLNLMQQFRAASDLLYRKNADSLNRAYDILAPEAHSDGLKTISLQDATSKLFAKEKLSDLTPTMLWTAHRTLAKIQNVSMNWHTYRLNPEFDLIPKQNLEHIDRVKTWMRDLQELVIQEQTSLRDQDSSSTAGVRLLNPIATFVRKARKAVIASRQRRPISPTGGIGPSIDRQAVSEPGKPCWTITQVDHLSHEEKNIVHYMDAWVTARYLNRHGTYAALGPMILRATGLYKDYQLNESAGFTFLQELGIISPWENAAFYSNRVGLPGHDPFHPVTVLRDEARRQASDFRMEDQMADFRKDWGDTPVFCVDSADTVERDDGVSVEEIGKEGSEAWLHIHVANPSAFIRPDSAIAKYGAKVSESIYLPTIKFPMLEPALSRDYLSLGANRPCMTFSARVNLNGDLLESTISHGIIRNVFYLTPQRLEEELGFMNDTPTCPTTLLTVGGIIPQPREAPETEDSSAHRVLSPEIIQQLHRWRTITDSVRRRRQGNGGIPWQSSPQGKLQPHVHFGDGVVDVPKPLSNKLQCYDGDPVISLVKHAEMGQNTLTMIEDAMVLAGEVCAKWCVDRHLPVPYRGIRINPEPAIDPAKFKHDVLDAAVEKHGHANQGDMARYFRLLGAGDCSASPLEHVILGLPAYVKITSPLRRYVDLLSHWQIEAAIRHGKQTGRFLPPPGDQSYLPFSYDSIEKSSKRLIARAAHLNGIKSGSWNHWVILAMFRAFYFHEAPLPDTFEITIINLGASLEPTRGFITDWGKSTFLQGSATVEAQYGRFQLDDIWEAKIYEINLYQKRIVMEPLRLLSRPG